MKALVFAAGLGTRLMPLTSSRPKALVEVEGKPLLYHVLTKLQNSGIKDITVNVHHFPDMIISYLEEHFPGVKVSDERDCLLETGGGILRARPFLDGDSFLVHNVDILSSLDLGSIPLRPGALATLVVSSRETSRYLLFDGDMRLVGWTNISTGEVRSPWPILDASRCRKLAFSGIHLIDKGIFGAFTSLGFSGRFPIMDFYLAACRDYPIYGYEPSSLELLDVGKPDTLDIANKYGRIKGII